MNRAPFYALTGLSNTYVQGGNILPVFKDICLEIQPGESVALMGPSGSGKSTLLHIAGLWETPTQGDVVIQGYPCGQKSDKE